MAGNVMKTLKKIKLMMTFMGLMLMVTSCGSRGVTSYAVEITMEGGSGKAGIESPVTITEADGRMTARLVWSSPNYDYMIVGGEKYLPVNTDGNSTFEIPVTVFDANMPVIADTTAMSEPHEIAYTLRFDSESIQKIEE